MDILVSLGITAATCWSVYTMFLPAVRLVIVPGAALVTERVVWVAGRAVRAEHLADLISRPVPG
jgi:hypothetical protein